MPTTSDRTLRILPMGESALLVEVDDLAAVLALERRLAPLVKRGEGVWGSVEEVVPAARTVLLVVRPGTDLAGAQAAVSRLGRRPADPRDRLGAATGEPGADRRGRSVAGDMRDGGEPAVEILVRYDGPDLPEVARATGLSPGEVVAAHTGTPWQVAFGGFAPGFAYLVGGDARLAVPRRATPRPRVPAGSVGLAGEFSGIYPRESPGGWQLIGTTDAPLWDPDREPPALLSPGVVVRFVDMDSR